MRAGTEEGCGTLRKSTRGRWRALSLTLVYVAAIAHYLHWYFSGRTVTPVEPSESMQTLEQGLVNAGFVFFGAAILSTLVLGRWFCGWGCHIVALQDLCTWLLGKLGLRPKPFRSRLLVFVPLLAALYMFVWPTVRRIWHAEPPPALYYHFLTYDYWATFPGVWVSALTFIVCGFFIVYLLGNKGFCTYGCPYGGVFGVVDLVAPGKIRVTDDCDGCGHCTATCTSNVRVHEEVRTYGMVVDPGCMKCTDCISVCPKHALYFGFGRPAAAKGRARAPRRRREFDYSWIEEGALAIAFLVALYAFRGLYDAIPFLLSLGLSSICAYLLVQVGRVFYLRSVRLHNVQLRLGGRITPAGWCFGTMGLLLAALVVHSALVQYHTHEADRLLAQAEAQQRDGRPGEGHAVMRSANASLAHLLWLTHYGLVPTAKVETQLGSLYLFLDRPEDACVHVERALALAPAYGAARYKQAELLARGGALETAVNELERAVHDDPALADARQDLIAASRRLHRLPALVGLLEEVVRRRPHDSSARLDLAVVLGESGAVSRGVSEAQQVVTQRPDWAVAHLRLALLLAENGDLSDACEACRRAVNLDPKLRQAREVLEQLTAAQARPGDPGGGKRWPP